MHLQGSACDKLRAASARVRAGSDHAHTRLDEGLQAQALRHLDQVLQVAVGQHRRYEQRRVGARGTRLVQLVGLRSRGDGARALPGRTGAGCTAVGLYTGGLLAGAGTVQRSTPQR